MCIVSANGAEVMNARELDCCLCLVGDLMSEWLCHRGNDTITMHAVWTLINNREDKTKKKELKVSQSTIGLDKRDNSNKHSYKGISETQT